MSKSTFEVGTELVSLCKEGKTTEAMEKLYYPHLVSVEAHGGGNMPQRIEGIEAVRGKAKWWYDNHTVHSGKVEGPWPHGDRFVVRFTYDVTGKAGPMAGKRMTLDEAALYTVKDGKIVQEEFFYHMG